VEKVAPNYVVIRRGYGGQSLSYAFSVDEILKSLLPVPDLTIGRAMRLREDDALPTISMSRAADHAFDKPSPRRIVVVDEDRPVGVIGGLNDLPTSEQLGELVTRMTEPAEAGGDVVLGHPPTFGVGTRTLPPVPMRVETETESAICHFFAEMDNEVIVNRVTTVEVIIAREAIEREVGPAAAAGPGVQVETQRKLIVQVIPRAHCEIVGEDRAEVDVPAPGNPLRLYFDVRPTHLGRRRMGAGSAGPGAARDTRSLSSDCSGTAARTQTDERGGDCTRTCASETLAPPASDHRAIPGGPVLLRI
jgi:Ternary complex associated domain 7